MTIQEPNQPRNSSPAPGHFRQFLRALWKAVSGNWLYKLVSLLLAIVLWAALITQDPNLTREKVFTDATATLVGSDNLRRNGFVVTSDLTDLLSGVTLRVEVPQLQYGTAAASSYNLRADLSRISQAGTQELRLQATNSTTYGTVVSIEPESVSVDVEAYITRYRIPVTVVTTGEMASGWYTTVPAADPYLITISGPESVVNSIVRAEATIDLSSLALREGAVRTSVPISLIDTEGLPVSTTQLEITSESVLIDGVVLSQTLYPTRTLHLNDTGLVVGTPAEGYEIKSVAITPAVVTAAGANESLSALDTLFSETTVDVSGSSASINRRLRLRQPSELVWLSTDTATVAVEIGPAIGSRVLEDVPIRLTGVSGGMNFNMSQATADVTLSGAELPWLNSLSAEDLILTCSVSGLASGTYDLPLVCTVTGADNQTYQVGVSPSVVQVTLSPK